VDHRVQALIGVACGGALLALPAAASAHSVIRVSQGNISYLASDATSLNTLAVKVTATEYEFHDPTVDGGIDPGSCRPGSLNAKNEVVQVFCQRSGIQTVRIDVGEREDKVTASLPIVTQILGGPGADNLASGAAADVLAGNDGNDVLAAGAGDDTLIGGEGDDQLDGGEGNDKIQAGGGADTVSGGAGDDTIETPDGVADTISCGDGNDTVEADTLDEVSTDCETVRRTFVAAPRDGAVGADSKPPQLAIGGSTLQRAGKRKRFFVAATSTERGTIAASGFLQVNGLALPLQSNRRRVPRGGHGVELTVKLSRGALAECRRAWRKGRKVRVNMGVVATDQAGNSTKPKTFKARLLP
jgi:hypothetical protein